MGLTSIEICAGAGGQALGLEQAGFEHVAVVELDPHACATLRSNRPYWNTLQEDLKHWRAARFSGQIDLFAGGVPCPPFSKAGKQLGSDDERDLFPTALRLIRECRPRAVLLENVRGLLDERFADYRADLECKLADEGYVAQWKLHHAADFGVPQLRPRTLLVALRRRTLQLAKATPRWHTNRRGGPSPIHGSWRMGRGGSMGRAGKPHRPDARRRIDEAWRP